jgi:hypothetical protein
MLSQVAGRSVFRPGSVIHWHGRFEGKPIHLGERIANLH